MKSKFIIAALLWALPSQSLTQSVNTYGNVGLIELPTAEVAEDGNISFSISQVGNSGRATVNFQLSPRIEGSIRYSEINGFGVAAENRSDRQFDFKINLLDEDTSPFGLALGFRDFLGSAIYSSEYLVASKKVGTDFRLTAGLGWGRLAGDGTFNNPFGGSRTNGAGGNEQVNSRNFFRGSDVGLFGGIAWEPSDRNWRLKAEYSPDNYAQESASGNFKRSSGWNFGIERELLDGFEAGLYWIGGEELGFRLSFSADPKVARVPKDFLNGPPPFTARPAEAKRGTNWSSDVALKNQLITALEPVFEAEGLELTSARFDAYEASVTVVNHRHDRPAKAVGRTARLLAAGTPPSVEVFRISLVENNLPTATVALRRSDLERLVDTHEAVPESWKAFQISEAASIDEPNWTANPERLSYTLAPKVPFSLFNSSLDFDLVLQGNAKYQLSPKVFVEGEMSQSLLGRLRDVSSASGPLPQVRSNFAAYQSDGPVLERLTANYVSKIQDGLYGRATVGYLERVFAGVSGELLWKDVDDPLAFGLELNYATQREPDSFAGLDGYDVFTGHGSLYWDTGWNGVFAQIDAGRYLAGDVGATLTVSRRFENGWEVAGYLTKTNADTSGSTSGSFDKGIRLTIPLGWTVPFATRRKLNVNFADLARDDGARLDIPHRLYPLVREVDNNRLKENWASFWQ